MRELKYQRRAEYIKKQSIGEHCPSKLPATPAERISAIEAGLRSPAGQSVRDAMTKMDRRIVPVTGWFRKPT